MMAQGNILEQIWYGVAVHLWQTTLILLALLIIARTIRNAPARFLNALWWIGFAKIFMPLALLGRAGSLLVSSVAGSALATGSYASLVSTVAARTSLITEPDLLVVGAGSGWGAPGQALFMIITVLWVTGAAWLALRLRGKDLSGPAPKGGLLECCTPEMRLRLERALPATGIDSGNVLVMPGAGVPAVAGLLRPRIVVPEVAVRELDPCELRAVLLHEDAHRRRYEPLRLALQRVALTLFFFYPPLWLLIRHLNSSAEMSCDEAVLQAGTAAETYTAAIKRMLGFGLEERLAATLLGLSNLSPIQTRLNRIRENRRYTAMKRHHLAVCAALLIVTLLSFLPMSPLADSAPVQSVTAQVESMISSETQAVETGGASETSESLPPAPPAPDKSVESGLFVPPAVAERAESGLFVPPELAETVRSGLLVQPAVTVGTESGFFVPPSPPAPPELDETAEAEPPAPPAPLEKVEAGPQLLQESVVLPVYPEEARKAGVQGRVVLEVLVKADGSVVGVVVKESVAGYPELERKAIEAVREWRFQPATINGNPVDSSVDIPIEFRLESKKHK
jgi:TonB family protein